MANCLSCGRVLPRFSFGEPGSLCGDCRRTAANHPSLASSQPYPAAPAPVVLRKRPVTTALIGINVAVFAVMALAGVSPVAPAADQLLKWGANWGPMSLGTQPWRIFTSNYLHIGIVHILLNMWCLWNLGSLAERIFEPWTYVLTYTVCGLAGSLASLWWHPLVVGAGASGAIFGMAGALIAALYLGKLPIPKTAMRGTLKSLLTFAGYNLFFGAVGAGIDNSAHIGGLLAGLALGAVLAKYLTTAPEIRDRRRQAVFVAAVLVLFAGFTLVKRANGYVAPMQQAITAIRKRDFDEAIGKLEQARARKPHDHDLLVLLGSTYLEKKDYAKSERASQQALQLEPDDFGAQYNLGLAQLKLGKNDQAIASLQRAVQLDPKYADAQEALGQAYQATGNQSAAKAALLRAAELRKAAPSPR